MGTIYKHHNDPNDPLFGETTTSTVPDPPSIPSLLSKTAFQDLAVANLGSGTTGMTRFQAIIDACPAGSGAVKFCFSRYEAAVTFEKADVANFTAIMVGASIMTQAEADAILNNWPMT